MGRGAKATEALSGHRTKAELEARKQNESAMLTGCRCFERDSVKNNPVAHKEYQRLTKLLAKIGKNDALYGSAINRYCELYSEIEDRRGDVVTYRQMVTLYQEMFEKLANEDADTDIDTVMKFQAELTRTIRQIANIDSAIMSKRKMMSDIEKENGWTVLSALRAVPKTAEKETVDPLIKALMGEE